MFGPNTYYSDNVVIDYSHRDKRFFDLFHDTRELFSKTFGLDDYDILFVPGSATIGIESVLFSLKRNVKMIGTDGTFKNRWNQMKDLYNKPSGQSIEMFCQLETSVSTPFSKEGCIVDAISAFPYYDIPRDTKVFVTCLNKQIGSYVGLAVVCVRKDFWNELIDDEAMSYLNLSRYRHYHDMDQAPSTSPTFIYEHLNKVLTNFDLDAHRAKIDRASDLIVDAIGEENIIGDSRCPAITLKPKVLPEDFAREHDVYGYWAGRPNYQIFTYSQDIEDYEKFAKEVRELRK